MKLAKNIKPLHILPFLFLLHLGLVSPLFFPALSDLGQYDEAFYIQNGRALAEGHPPLYAYNPLGAFLYSGLFHLLPHSPFWLILAAGAARFILFSLLWLSCGLLAHSVGILKQPWLMLGLLFISPAALVLVKNSSYALFSGFSMLAFWQVVMFCRRRVIFHLICASWLAGIAALARNDGLFLIFCLILAGLVIHWAEFRRIRFKSLAKIFLASALPFMLIVGGYLMFYAHTTGRFELGTMRRAYGAFESARWGVYRLQPTPIGQPAVFRDNTASRIFGTSQENNYSIFRAISHNPRAFLARVRFLLMRAPLTMVNAYGKGLGILLFLLVFLGIAELLKKKEYLLLSLCLIWPLHLIVYFAFHFRRETLLMPHPIVFFLAAMGMRDFMDRLQSKKGYLTLQIFGGVLFFLGIILYRELKRDELLAGAAALLCGLFLVREILKRRQPSQNTALILILCLGALMSQPYLIPKFRKLGTAPDEQAVLFMRDHFKSGTLVASCFPAPVWASGMEYVSMIRRLRGLDSEKALVDWFSSQKCRIIYLDQNLGQYEPRVYALIRSEIGKRFRALFSSSDGKAEILSIEANSR